MFSELSDTGPAQTGAATSGPSRKKKAWVAGMLVVAIWAVFAQVWWFDYLIVEDATSVAENPFVRGLTPRTVVWAFTSSPTAVWHPLTWISYQIDAQIFGKSAAVFHGVNLVLHTANALLVFVLLHGLTGRFWSSAAVAFLFGLHPLCVEPVAWISQRKLILGTFLGLLSIKAYTLFARRQSRRWYTASLALFVLCLMAWPALLVLPLLMLLIDNWPLARFNELHGVGWLRAAARDKLPFLALSALFGAIALAVMNAAEPVHASARVSLPVRLANAVAVCALYLWKAAWPNELAVFYPHPGAGVSPLLVAISAMVVALCSLFAWRLRHAQPYLAFGWFWYLLALLPVLGVVQIGPYPMADRFMYVPIIGPAIAACWFVASTFPRPLCRPAILGPVAAFAVAALGVRAFGQTRTWRDSLRLLNHAAAVAPKSAITLNNLGMALEQAGKHEEAAGCYEQALSLDPQYPAAWRQVGLMRARAGNLEQALASFERARALAPRDTATLAGLADVLARLGRADEALEHLQSAIAVNPGNAVARKILVLHLRQLGRYDEALEQISTATRLDPEAIWAYILLGSLLAEAGREDEAEGAFNQAIAMDPSNAEAHNDLGVLKHSQGYYDEAVVQFREARKRDRHNRAYLENLSGALIEAGIRQAINDQPHMALESMREALELTPKSFFANHRMARLLANDRKFKEAETHFKQAVASDADVSRASPADIAQAHFELGVMLARLDRMLEARRAFEQALELHPEFPAAKAALHRTRMALGTMPRDTEE